MSRYPEAGRRSLRRGAHRSRDWAGRPGAERSWSVRLLEDLKVPVVLDADGINALDGHIDILDGRQGSHRPDAPRRRVRPADRAAPCRCEDRLAAARDFAAGPPVCAGAEGAPHRHRCPRRHGPGSTPRAIRAWPRGAAATCWPDSSLALLGTGAGEPGAGGPAHGGMSPRGGRGPLRRKPGGVRS